MSKRQDQEREQRLQPIRLSKAIEGIEALGFNVDNVTGVSFTFEFQGAIITYYPYSGWATGRTIDDGRGLQKLLNQLT